MDSPVESGQAVPKARELLSQGKPAEAEPLLRELLDVQSNHAEANSLLGASLSMQGRDAESVPYLERAVGLDSTRAPYFYNLGAVLERLGDTARATECYRRAVELDPQYSRAAHALQRLYRPGASSQPVVASPIPSASQPSSVSGFPPVQPIATDLAGNPVETPIRPAPSMSTPGAPAAHPSLYTTPGSIPGPYTSTFGFGGGNYAMAPQIVKSARFVCLFLGSLIGLISVVMMLFLAFADNSGSGGPLFPLIGSVIYGGIAVLYLWLASALKRGVPAAWTVQLVLAIFGLLGFPLGTLISILILASWFKPETKAWFGRM